MDDATQRKLAFNETLARDVNERVSDVSSEWFGHEEQIEFRCECADESCYAPIRLTRDQYLGVREDARQFVVVPGHENPEIEEVVAELGEWSVVRKTGAGVDVAESR